MKNKQTAVEWLIEQWPILESQLPDWLIEQAKAMEKEQIKDAWDNGIQWEWDSSIRNSEEYYNETFKSE
jgi:hypothetical protein